MKNCWHWGSFSGTAFFSSNGSHGRDSVLKTWSEQAPTAYFHSPLFPHLHLKGQWDVYEPGVLAESLGLTACPPPREGDLILHAFAKWGELAPSHLDGSFAFAIFDEKALRFFACRDHMGSLPFVYTRNRRTLTFAGDMQTLLRVVAQPELNEPVLTSCKLLWTYRPEPGQTFFRNIFSIPPGHYLVSTPEDDFVRPYWQPAIRPELVPAKEEDVFEQTRSLVERAVLNRCSKRKSLGVMYSGGLDSSVLVGVAAQVLKKSNRSVIALSAVNDERHASIADERSYMAALSGLDNLHIEYVGASGQGPFDDLNKPDRFDTTCIRYSRAFLDDALQDRAASLGVDVLFSGEFGEATISANPSPHVLECAVRLRLATMVRELRGYAKRSGRSAFWHLGAEAWRQVVPKALSDPTYYLSPDLLKEFPPVPLPAYPLWPDTRQTKLADTLRMRLCDVYMSTRDPELVFSPTKPFKDKNLLEFCLALPAKFKSRNGVGRYLLRRSFAGLLPEKIISRPGKLPYSPDYFSRYEEQLPAAVEFVRSIRKSDPVRDVVDVDRLSAAVNRALPLQPRDRPAIASIPNTIYLIQFLRHFSAFRV